MPGSQSYPEQPKLTIKQVADSLHPGWNFKKDWLCWPPDTFALISLIMERTGCYRLCLIDPTWWRLPTYSESVNWAADHWLTKTTQLLEGKGSYDLDDSYFMTACNSDENVISQKEKESKIQALEKFKEAINIIDNYWNGFDKAGKHVDLEKLRTINYGVLKEDPYRKLTEALIQIMAIADTACVGMGLLEKSSYDSTDTTKLTHCLANLLLTATGSLSTLPKFQGTVLPKMRTPQGGITTRSLSHHLTFHSTEVEVMWRTIPWSNHHQKTLNIIVVPYPFEVSEDNFEARSERFHSVQYFSYQSTLNNEEAQKKAEYYLDKIVDLVWTESKKLDQVHILVFPESALSDDQYTYIKKKFYDRLVASKPDSDTPSNTIHHLPLIVAGIHNGKSKPYEGEADRPGNNEARMATFFAGKWYDVAQRKHHRWHLNNSQLVQYWLAGKLPSERRWFEHISVAQRRLTILAPTGWLALSALICEDLAQLEPVSSIIRGIGPTFLMALLSDGPQINSRWSARYANVMADDPGTGVLSLTSLGMVKRSRKLTNGLYIDNDATEVSSSHTVALWKDMLRGHQEINLTKDRKAVRLTISAEFAEEYTLDGRSDGEQASVFRLEGFEQLTIPDPEFPRKNGNSNTDSDVKANKNQLSSKQDKNLVDSPIATSKPIPGNWTDIRELTALQFALDSLIELRGKYCEEICGWFRAEPDFKLEYPLAIQTVIKLTGGAFKNPGSYGIDSEKSGWNRTDGPTDVEIASLGFMSLFNRPELKLYLNSKSSAQYYQKLFEAAKDEFKNNKAGAETQRRIFYLVPLATMYLIRAKVSVWQSTSIDVNEDDDIKLIVNLRKEIRQFIIENQYSTYEENVTEKKD